MLKEEMQRKRISQAMLLPILLEKAGKSIPEIFQIIHSLQRRRAGSAAAPEGEAERWQGAELAF